MHFEVFWKTEKKRCEAVCRSTMPLAGTCCGILFFIRRLSRKCG